MAAMADVASTGRLSVSHDPRSNDNLHENAHNNPNDAANESAGARQGWLEILHGGMTFDITGLRPADALPVSRGENLFQMDQTWPTSSLAALPITAGPHLAGTENTLPVVRALLDLAAQLSEIEGCVGICWRPARSWMGRKYFQTIVNEWMKGGPFPSLGLVSLRPALDGALQSEGLSFFLDRELRIAPEIAADRISATKVASRLIDSLIEEGPIHEPLKFEGMSGERLRLDVSANQRYFTLARD
ncbi:hypothetical protein [Altererythrobacter aquiaggeris]|uniref:hypothetical protein n=1 Tax=Aestuarierythrobacter aquiaggeris TaxID=1898396 RepID=UPI003018B939